LERLAAANISGMTPDRTNRRRRPGRAAMTDTVSVLEGNTFVLGRRNGDVDAGPGEPHGLFHRDTRHLSRWLLTVDGKSLDALSTDDTRSFAARFFLVPGTGSEYTDATMSVIRHRIVGDGFFEELTVLNHSGKSIRPKIELSMAADFADLFEVKDATISKPGKAFTRVEDGLVVLGYERAGYIRETWIRPHDEAAEVAAESVVFQPEVGPGGSWTAWVEVVAAVDGTPAGHEHTRYTPDEEPRPQAATRARPGRHPRLSELVHLAPPLETDWEPLKLIYARSIVDLAALRFYPRPESSEAVPAAGLPWFQTLFGRDSLITSYQALHVDPDLAATTLDVLASMQGTRHDDFRDEEPGKILHELRFGELTAFKERPHSPYYGSADGTMLFLILLDEYERFTGDTERVRRLEPNARAALAWIDNDGDRDGDGYVEYEGRNVETGLENQCWKDSWNSILFADGSLAKLPRATCELQGYAYDARRRAARLAREVWHDEALASKLEGQADELKRAFNRDFWLDDRGYFALALDGDKRAVDSLTSNIGHLLWSGIVEEDRAGEVVAHLMGPRLFSGWGIRTMAEGDGGYNPIGYHQGTVWPHDNSLIAAGLRRYGFDEEAATISLAILEAAQYFLGRLPETFAGYERSLTDYPVEYPTACSPQAWATAAPLFLIRVLLGLEAAAGAVGQHRSIPTARRLLAHCDSALNPQPAAKPAASRAASRARAGPRSGRPATRGRARRAGPCAPATAPRPPRRAEPTRAARCRCPMARSRRR
jgi:glycogen debranching enzyme